MSSRAFTIFLISCGWAHSMDNYQRLEASAGKCRQMTTFFSAAPEAVVQLTVLLVSEAEHLNLDSKTQGRMWIGSTF